MDIEFNLHKIPKIWYFLWDNVVVLIIMAGGAVLYEQKELK